MTRPSPLRSALVGVAASVGLFAFYSTVLALVSGRDFLATQIRLDAPFLAFLVPSFGLVAGMYAHLRAVSRHGHGKAVAASGGMSGAAMVACCAHYLPTVLPFLGVTAFATVVTAWRTPLLVVAVVSNLAGLTVVARALRKATRDPADHAAHGNPTASSAIDPVCGMPLDPAASAPVAVHLGKTYSFCSTACRDRFNADPERFAAVVA